MKEPVDHVLRPLLPWRSSDGALTECGLNAAKVSTLTREAFVLRWKDYGQQRTAMTTCMTCSDTARRWGTWNDDPRHALNREIMWETYGGYRSRSDRGERLKNELLAIAALIENHRDEFDATIAADEQRREWIEKKAALGKKKPVPAPKSIL